MNLSRTILSPRVLSFLLLTALLMWLEVTVTHTIAFSRHPMAVSFGVLFDLVFVTTGAFYWLVARPFHLAHSRLLFMALLMLRIALFILPESPVLPNQFWPLLLVFTEGAVLIIAGLRIRIILRTYRHLRPLADVETALRGSFAAVFGDKVAGIIIGEGLIVYYTLLGWRLQPDVPVNATILTMHRQSGQMAMVVGLLSVGLTEGIGVHLLLTRWNPTIAVWVTALSIYGLLFFVADAVATLKRPSYLSDNQLHLRLGVRWRAILPGVVITDVVLIHDKPIKQPGRLNGAFLTTPNVLLTFSKPISFSGPYGIQKEFTQLAFFVDNRAVFVRQITEISSD